MVVSPIMEPGACLCVQQIVSHGVSMTETTFFADPLSFIILVILLIVLLPIVLWLGITLLWVGAGLIAGAFVYFFVLNLFGIPLLATAAGIAVAILIWASLLR
jgi:hypothetical protein